MTLDEFFEYIEFDSQHCFSNCYHRQIEHMIQEELVYRYKDYGKPVIDADHDTMYQNLMVDMVRWYDQGLKIDVNSIDHFVLVFRPLFVWITFYKQTQCGRSFGSERRNNHEN